MERVPPTKFYFTKLAILGQGTEVREQRREKYTGSGERKAESVKREG